MARDQFRLKYLDNSSDTLKFCMVEIHGRYVCGHGPILYQATEQCTSQAGEKDFPFPHAVRDIPSL